MQQQQTLRALILKCARMLSEEINQILEPLGLNYSLWQVIYVIDLKGHCTLQDIAEYLNVSKPSITKRIKILQQMKVLTQLETEDKRQKMLSLSDQGQQLYLRCSPYIDVFEQQLLADVSQQQQHDAKSTMESVMQQLQLMKSGAI
ncbi:MarR family winged helix-turn-helix transcriptional regulator [Acinetobacter piscicola]|uniref:MarR family winged helix-turn-helix transcriptional regulator n=1 Tax=Acinetobacter piscicola TaxID=2006115 RepID=UPI00101EAE6A|nr:MarR family transcriptional regulator [Acinetobacter piscicola]RYL27269.1 MarR family transcriptional regulator [Acinetobacter piscicola]